jgi:eukaryotic-like serine/threonine-protein kinase
VEKLPVNEFGINEVIDNSSQGRNVNPSRDRSDINTCCVSLVLSGASTEYTTVKIKLVQSMLQVCLQQSWPQDKPIAAIVFPQIIPSSLGNLAAQWVMLPKQDILHHLYSKPFKHFFFIESPYPMLLWITALHNQEHGTRWLPCYLDLKEPKSLEIVERLAKTSFYRLLLFSTEQPQRCAQVMTVTLSSNQCQRLQEWTEKSQTIQSTARPIESRRLLKAEFENLKSQFPGQLNVQNLALAMAL